MEIDFLEETIMDCKKMDFKKITQMDFKELYF
jgi:hypothetical protein